jgi:hypothetical protein
MAPVAEQGSLQDAVPLLGRDCRGVVYVEFLVAFVPLFVMFLGTCQMALLATARIAVRQAAFAAVRTAVVVLEDAPEEFDDAPRGSLSKGAGSARRTMSALFTGISAVAGGFAAPSLGRLHGAAHGPQRGARMAPIRAAAYVPLFGFVPREESIVTPVSDNLGRSLPVDVERRFSFAVDYLQSASAVTLQAARGDDALATDPVAAKAVVTVRVTYLYPCSVPVVRSLMCKTLSSLLGSTEHHSAFGIPIPPGGTELRARLELAEAPGALETLAGEGARFIAMDAEASLPNQGAGYEPRAGE